MRKLKTSVKAGLLIAYTAGSMYLGDQLGVQRQMISLKDQVFRTQTADGFASYQNVNLETKVDDNNKRKTYLKLSKDDYTQKVPVKANGYAEPRSMPERFGNFYKRKTEELSEEFKYDDLESLGDKLELMFKNYKIKVREFMENVR